MFASNECKSWTTAPTLWVQYNNWFSRSKSAGKSVFQLDYKIGLEPSELKQTDLSGMENIIAQMIMFEIEASILSVRMRYSSIDLVISSLNIYVHFYLQLLSALAFYENKKKEEGSVMPIRDFYAGQLAPEQTERKRSHEFDQIKLSNHGSISYTFHSKT